VVGLSIAHNDAEVRHLGFPLVTAELNNAFEFDAVQTLSIVWIGNLFAQAQSASLFQIGEKMQGGFELLR
jgi:hypothetical protein